MSQLREGIRDSMFRRFCNEFGAEFQKLVNQIETLPSLFGQANGAESFIESFSGCTFKNGLYRIHDRHHFDKWTKIVGGAFPTFAGRIQCFGYDWLGRQFALDSKRLENGEPLILMLEPGTGEVLEIPTTFSGFHEEELIECQDAALAKDFFINWYNDNPQGIKHHQCAGYKVPLFLGGLDTVENLQLVDLEVYWEVSSQLLNSTRDLPVGTVIREVKIL
jgi:hypothetical protein